MPEISVIIPTIPPRKEMLNRAIASISTQTRQPVAIHIAVDTRGEGAAITRDRALAAVQTEWVAPLDDDDEFLPNHLEALLTHALAEDATLIYPWFEVGSGGTDPFPHHFGKPFDPAAPCQVPVTFLARTGALRAAGGFSAGWDQNVEAGLDAEGNRAGEDYRLLLRLVDQGAKIVHLPHITWRWHHHSANTSGLASRVPC